MLNFVEANITIKNKDNHTVYIMTTDLLSAKVDSSLKIQFTNICEKAGLSPSQAIELFAQAVINHGGIPFELKINQPNKITLQAMQEIEDGNTHQASSTQQLITQLNS